MGNDIHTAGLAVGVTLRIKALTTRIRAIAKALAGLDSSTFLGMTLGRFDVVAVLVARSRIEAAKIMDNQIANMNGVQEIDVQSRSANLSTATTGSTSRSR